MQRPQRGAASHNGSSSWADGSSARSTVFCGPGRGVTDHHVAIEDQSFTRPSVGHLESFEEALLRGPVVGSIFLQTTHALLRRLVKPAKWFLVPSHHATFPLHLTRSCGK